MRCSGSRKETQTHHSGESGCISHFLLTDLLYKHIHRDGGWVLLTPVVQARKHPLRCHARTGEEAKHSFVPALCGHQCDPFLESLT